MIRPGRNLGRVDVALVEVFVVALVKGLIAVVEDIEFVIVEVLGNVVEIATVDVVEVNSVVVVVVAATTVAALEKDKIVNLYLTLNILSIILTN